MCILLLGHRVFSFLTCKNTMNGFQGKVMLNRNLAISASVILNVNAYNAVCLNVSFFFSPLFFFFLNLNRNPMYKYDFVRIHLLAFWIWRNFLYRDQQIALNLLTELVTCGGGMLKTIDLRFSFLRFLW